jgi:16S rRNA (uracil1498-N3)-methyltransferase
MRIPRLFIPKQLRQGEEVLVTGQTAHHVAHVLRLRSGAPVQVFDGSGSEHCATIKLVKRSEITLKLAEAAAVRPESTLDITLLQGITRNDRMDTILQKSVELGIKNIQPLWMQRSQTHLKGDRLEKRFQHWRNVVISACEQCGRATVPTLAVAMDYPDWIGTGKSDGLRLLLQPDSKTGLGSLNPPGDKFYVLVGPEGGLNTDEQTLAVSAGFCGISLGPRILRTETAALAVLAGIQSLWGDFN